MYIYYNNITYIILFAYNKISVFNGRHSSDGLPRIRREPQFSFWKIRIASDIK